MGGSTRRFGGVGGEVRLEVNLPDVVDAGPAQPVLEVGRQEVVAAGALSTDMRAGLADRKGRFVTEDDMEAARAFVLPARPNAGLDT